MGRLHAEAQTIAMGLFHLRERHASTAVRAKPVAMLAEMRLEERSYDLCDRLLNHSIQYGWYAQRTLPSGGFGYPRPFGVCAVGYGPVVEWRLSGSGLPPQTCRVLCLRLTSRSASSFAKASMDMCASGISPDKNANCNCTTSAFTSAPEPRALACCAALPGSSALYAVSVRKLTVLISRRRSSKAMANRPASRRPAVALRGGGLPRSVALPQLPSSSIYPKLKLCLGRFTYRGL